MSRSPSSISATLLLAGAALVGPAVAFEAAPNAAERGPFATASGEYRLPAQVFPDVRDGVVTELWARTHYPVDATGDLPVLVFLHGNHSTCGRGSDPRIDDNCQYTNSGTCPNGYVVVPNHEGYDYIGEPLASWGYVVVSINANRGINCAFGPGDDFGLNKARGRLILKHLQLVSAWNLGLVELPGGFDPSLQGRLDYQQVGLMGHSRGGEGARAAYNFCVEPGSEWQQKILEPVEFHAILEIGAVDGQTDTEFNAERVAWNQVLPMCDGDVSDLQGIKPMDRMMDEFGESPARLKSSYTVWGANHNFFNTEWQVSESRGCIDHQPLPEENTGSAAQRTVGRSVVMAMFRGAVGPDADPEFLRNLNPAYKLPQEVLDITRVDRGYIDSPRALAELPLEDFTQPTGTNRWGFANARSGITLSHTTVPDHDPGLRAARVGWDLASPETYLLINTADPGEGRDLSAFATLDFRVSRRTSQPDFSSSTDFSISLIDGNGTESVRVPLSDYSHLTGPVGGDLGFLQLRHPILQTVRIPLTDLAGVDLTRFRSVRFSFDIPNPGQTNDDGGAIHIADIRLSRRADEPCPPELADRSPVTPAPARTAPALPARLEAIREVGPSDLVGGRPAIEVTVATAAGFPVGDSLPELRIGSATSRLGRYSDDTRSLTFTFAAEELTERPESDPIELQIGGLGLWRVD